MVTEREKHDRVTQDDGEKERRRRERQRRKEERDELLARLRPLSLEQLADIVEIGAEVEQAAAVEALAEKPDPRFFPLLLDTLETTESYWVRHSAALALHDRTDQRAFVPLLRTIRRLCEENGSVGTLIYALESLDARAALPDLARILCEGSDEKFEPAWSAIMVILTMKSPLPLEAYAEGLRLLKDCLAAGGHPDWKEAWLQDAIAHIERCGDDLSYPPRERCCFCGEPIRVHENDPFGVDLLPKHWQPREDAGELEIFVCHRACLARVLHPDAEAELRSELEAWLDSM